MIAGLILKVRSFYHQDVLKITIISVEDDIYCLSKVKYSNVCIILVTDTGKGVGMRPN
jgi:hypothetical protein